MTRLSTDQALKAWEKILFEVKHEFDADIDEVKPLKMQPYDHCAIPLEDYQKLGCTRERRDIKDAIRSHFFNLRLNNHTLILGAGVAFGVGACAESVAQAMLKCSVNKDLLATGYLINLALANRDNLTLNHNFLIFVPQDIFPPRGRTDISFSQWLQRIDESHLDRMILVDVWRSVITRLNFAAKNSLICSLMEFGMDKILSNQLHFYNASEKDTVSEIFQAYLKNLEAVYDKECQKPEVMGFFMKVRKKETEINELTRRLQELYPNLTFSNYTRAGFYTDAIAELTTQEMREAAATLLTQIGSAKLREYNGVPILVLEKINANVELAAKINELWETTVRPTLRK